MMIMMMKLIYVIVNFNQLHKVIRLRVFSCTVNMVDIRQSLQGLVRAFNVEMILFMVVLELRRSGIQGI